MFGLVVNIIQIVKSIKKTNNPTLILNIIKDKWVNPTIILNIIKETGKGNLLNLLLNALCTKNKQMG
jgi:hypothetical protein